MMKSVSKTKDLNKPSTLEPSLQDTDYDGSDIRQFKGGPKSVVSKQKCLDYIEK